MSLVHQALRKAEQEKLRKTSVVAGPSRVLRPPTPAAPAEPVGSPRPVEPVVPAAVAAAPAPVPRTASQLLPVLLSCVAFVAIVAMVFLVLRANLPQPQVTDPVAPPATGPVGQAAAVPVPETAARGETPAPSPAEDRWRVTGIAQDPDGRPTAIINGQARYEGQFIDGAVVQRIERDRVTFDVDGRTVVKRLF